MKILAHKATVSFESVTRETETIRIKLTTAIVEHFVNPAFSDWNDLGPLVVKVELEGELDAEEGSDDT